MMNRPMGKLRGLEIAHNFLKQDDQIDVVVTFNNVMTKMPVTINKTTIAFPPEYPYMGLRGPLGDVEKTLSDSASTFTTVALAPILGIEPLGITKGDFKAASILKEPQQFKGKGTLIGIIDTGIDYTNPVFIDNQGMTRIEAIWDQTIGDESKYGYGTIYEKGLINEALKMSDPFLMVPHKDEWGEGTMLAAIAAGSGTYEGGKYIGTAPEAELIVVKLRPASVAMQKVFHGKYNPLAFSSLDIALAVQYICNVAARLQKPISICLPVGGNTGPHDSSEALTNVLDSYAVNRGMCFVLAAGDEANKKNHASGNLKENPFQQVKLTIPKGQEGFVVEIWASFGDQIEASLVQPQKETLPPSLVTIVVLNKPQSHEFDDGSSVWTLGSVIDPETGCQVIRFRLNNPGQGDWTLSIRGVSIINGTYHIWIPKTGMILPETILSPASPFTTIYNVATAQRVITVGCYDKTALSPCAGSGRGPTRDHRMKPDFLVEGVNIPAPLPNNRFGFITGTAASAAITAGICAISYENQIHQNADLLNTPMMRCMLVDRLIREETISYPTPSRGYGLLDINTAIY